MKHVIKILKTLEGQLLVLIKTYLALTDMQWLTNNSVLSCGRCHYLMVC